jgi:hypothetical protein
MQPVVWGLMSFSLLRPLCLVRLHRPSETETRPSGTDFVSRCSRCGKQLIKKRLSKKWVAMKAPSSRPRKRRR